ncbi:hypothetical protein C1H46_040575 [Malus baccata]|uniref:Uncharacterized protein n=1 Tax=Malus baccata TaxID=106549 RepID=A0A540KI26_MALBA|nr:hypothetical protein C1H46_040575 [Malus baccata]
MKELHEAGSISGSSDGRTWLGGANPVRLGVDDGSPNSRRLDIVAIEHELGGWIRLVEGKDRIAGKPDDNGD